MSRITNPYERRHIAHLAQYAKQIDAIYRTAVQEAAAIAAIISDFESSRLFSFNDYPVTHQRVQSLLSRLNKSTETAIVNGINAEWTLANNKNNELSQLVFGNNVGRLTPAQYRRYFSTNDNARQAFLQRKEQGLNLSERVWQYTNAFRREIELGLDIGLRNGLSADEMSRELRQYLKYPDKLFRRVRDEHGNLVLSKRAAEFHPGQGVYRSSYKNARRLAVTETNIAYRTADYERYQQLDFVVGIEIRLSNNHTCNGLPLYDICDELCGRYPKDFKFTGWHPHCRCHVVSILKTEEELMRENEAILAGEEPTEESVNRVADVPERFREWVKNNADRIKHARSIPYFMQDNGTIEKGVFTLKEFKGTTPATNSLVGNTTIQTKHIAGDFVSVKKADALPMIIQATGCTDKEAELFYRSVRDYTYGWDYDIRRFQRGERNGFRPEHSIKDIEKKANAIEEFIRQSPKWDGGDIYRGMAVSPNVLDEIIDSLQRGECNMLGCSSWASKEYIARRFTSEYLDSTNTKRVIFVCKKAGNATSIQHISKYHGQEAEVLASKDVRYKLVSIYQDIRKANILGEVQFTIIEVEAV